MLKLGSIRSAVLGGALFLGGCTGLPELDVEHQWGDAMRRLNMFGFYPPTEDVQIGDVFLHAPPRDGSPSLPQFSLRRLGSYRPSAVFAQLRGQQDRDHLRIQPLPSLLGTTGDRPRSPVSREWHDGVAMAPNCRGYAIGNADNLTCAVRLQRSAIPGLAVGRLTNAQLGAAGVLGNVGARLGFGQSSATAVNITLSNVQELSLDTWRLARLRESQDESIYNIIQAERLLSQLSQLRPELLAAACAGDRSRLAAHGVEVAIVTRIIYAGEINYNFTRNAETAVRLAVDLQGTLPGQAPQMPAAAPAASASAVVALPATPEAAGQRLATLLNGVTGETGTDAARAGASVSFGIGTFGNLTLKEKFNRPMAVGAGALIRSAFHEFLAGDPGLPTPGGTRAANLAEFRFQAAKAYCGGVGLGTENLREAMGLL